MCVRACVRTFSSLPPICLPIWNYVTTETFIADKTSPVPAPTFSSKISLLLFRILDWNFTKFLPPPMHWKFFYILFCIQIRLVKVHTAYLVSIYSVFPIICFMSLSRWVFSVGGKVLMYFKFFSRYLYCSDFCELNPFLLALFCLKKPIHFCVKNSLIISSDFTGDADRFQPFCYCHGQDSLGITEPVDKTVRPSVDKITPSLENGT